MARHQEHWITALCFLQAISLPSMCAAHRDTLFAFPTAPSQSAAQNPAVQQAGLCLTVFGRFLIQ